MSFLAMLSPILAWDWLHTQPPATTSSFWPQRFAQEWTYNTLRAKER